MKTVHFVLFTCLLCCTFACDKSTDVASTGPDLGITVSPRSGPNYPPLESDFARGFDINNAGVISGTIRDEEGKNVVLKLSNHDTWLAEEEVSTVAIPTIRFAINDRGDIAGHKLIPGGVAPAIWMDGQAFEMDPLPGYEFGLVYDINTSGLIVGESLNGNYVTSTSTRATVFTIEEGPIDLGALGGSRGAALGVNDHGQIVGTAETAQGQLHAFLYEDGVMTDLGTLGGTTSNANRINNRGEIVGRSFLANGAIRAFHYTDGVMTDLGTLGGASSVALDINDNGEIIGFSRIATGQIHAFLYKDGIMQDLGTLGGLESWATGINNRGDITGYYTLPGNIVRAFLYRDGVMTTL
jgi:probable HAF family extracellular repeat protein